MTKHSSAAAAAWQIYSPATEALSWQQVWSSEDRANIRVVAIDRVGAQGCYRLHRIESGTGIGAGAVAVPVGQRDGQPTVLLVSQERVGPAVRLWELPRGMADPQDSDLARTALRELEEETGLGASRGELIAEIFPDSGLLAGHVGVVVVEMPDCPAPSQGDGEVDDARWFSVPELVDLIASGQLRDGISLSALTVTKIWLERSAAGSELGSGR